MQLSSYLLLLLQSYAFIFNVTALVILVSACLPPLLQFLQKKPHPSSPHHLSHSQQCYIQLKFPYPKFLGLKVLQISFSQLFKYFYVDLSNGTAWGWHEGLHLPSMWLYNGHQEYQSVKT